MRFFIIALISLLFAASSALAYEPADGHKILFGDPKTEWLNTARPVTVDDAKGRMVLLDFWTYGCINCMHVVPDLKKLEADFGDKLLVIGVHSAKFKGEQGSQRILAAASRFGLTHPVINDSEFDIWDAFHVQAWPTLILLNGDGAEVARYSGEGHYEDIKKDISDAVSTVTAAPVKSLKLEKAKDTALSFPARLGYAKDTPWGPLLFVADSGHNRLLGMTLDGQVKTVIGSGVEGSKDGDFKTAQFHNPRGFGIVGNGAYIADTENHLIRYADFKTGQVTTVAGNGEQAGAQNPDKDDALKTGLSSPWDVKLMADGKTLAIAMAGTHQLWTYSIPDKTVSLLAGTGKESIDDGDADDASLSQPSGVAPWGDTLYFVDAETSSLRALKFGEVSTLVGTGLFDFGLIDGSYPKARMQHAQGLSVDGARILVADTYNNSIRLYDIATGVLSTLKIAPDALAEPGDILNLNGKLYVADTDHNRVATIDEKSGTVVEVPVKLP